ncbi:MAG TPA: YIP1 family protein [Ignavibacteria bacterium]|nr:YIP1 family protein [Ignavibacteria bacterium]
MEENKEQLNTAVVNESPEIPENISIGDAMAGVFSEPGETFRSVKLSAKKNYWLIPLLILIVVSMLSSILVTRDEELTSEIKTQQKEAMKKRFDEAIKEGKMTKEQADEQLAQTEKMFGGITFVIFGLIGSIAGVLIIFFLKALIYWGGLKLFKGTAGYGDIMNVLGLTALITAIQMVVDTVLAILMGKLLMNIGPVLLISKEAVSKDMFAFIANFDLINIWYTIIVGIGLAKVSELKSSVTIPFVFVLWLIWVLLSSFGPFGMFMGR